MLCADCARVCIEESTQPFKPSFRALKESARRSCRLCLYLQKLLETHEHFLLYDPNTLDDFEVRLIWYEKSELQSDGGGKVWMENPTSNIGYEERLLPQVQLEISTDRGKPLS
jgi:hypothetical protein